MPDGAGVIINPLILGTVLSGIGFPSPAIVHKPEPPRIIRPEKPGLLMSATFPFPVFSPASAAATGIQYVGGQVASTVGVTSDWTVNFALTGGLAATPAAGDYVIVAYAVSFNTDRDISIASPGDYVSIGTDTYANDTNDTNAEVFAKFMGGSPDTSVTLTQTGNVQAAGTVYISVWRGVNIATPMDVAAVVLSGIDTMLADPGSITPVTSGAIIVAIGAANPSSNGNIFTSSDLSDFKSVNQIDTLRSLIGGGYKVWTSGAFDPAVFSIGGSDNAAERGH